MIEGDAVLQLQLAVHHLEAVIGNGIVMRIPGVLISQGEIADDRARLVFSNGVVRKGQPFRRVIGVGDVNRHHFFIGCAVFIGRDDRHLKRVLRFIIQRNALLEAQFITDNFEKAGRVVRKAERHRIVRIRIGCAQGEDNRASLVFKNRIVGKQNVRWRVIDLRKDQLVILQRSIRPGCAFSLFARRCISGGAGPGRAARLRQAYPDAGLLNPVSQQAVAARAVRRSRRRSIVAVAAHWRPAFGNRERRRARAAFIHIRLARFGRSRRAMVKIR